tara:strand:- start:3330 stop:3584 length:255 start_codon:yes stop_codon:yes gene_type:complete
MEIILIALVVIIYLLNFSKNKTPNIQTKNTNIKQKLKSRAYSPGQVKKKPKVSPESKLDPITWDKFFICQYCGSENRREVECCK